MPLKKGYSKEAVSANIKTEMASGRPQRQAGKSGKVPAKKGK